MRFLARYSIGVKLLVTPALVTGLLVLLAGAAHYGLRLQHAALERIYETRIQRLLATNSGLNDVRSVNEEVYVVLADYRDMLEAGGSDFEDLKRQADAIRTGLEQSRQSFEAASGQAGLTADERAAYRDVLTTLTGFRDALEPALEMVAGAGSAQQNVRSSMTEAWFGNFLNAARRLNDIQHRLSGEDYEAARQIAAFGSRFLAGAAVLAIIVAVASALAIRAQIVGSVQGIRDAAQRLQEGDFTQRVAVVGRDEVAQSAQAFNRLVDGIQQLVRQVLDGAGDLTTAARSLAADAQTAERGADRQSHATEAVRATVEEMAVSITAVADGTEQVRANSQRSLHGTQAGRVTLTRMRDEADRVQAAFVEIQSSIEDFIERTAAISELTSKVKALAGQTNLLALNAAIEAARAGEQGRGFAVVADEVRKLAEHSTGAASHIEEVAAGLGARSETVGQSLQSGHRSLASTLEQLATLQQVIAVADDAVATTTQEIDGIAAAVNAQSRGSTEVASNVDEIARMCGQNARVVIEAARAAARLEHLATGLEASVAKFRV